MVGGAMSDMPEAHSIRARLIGDPKTVESQSYSSRRHIDLIVLTGFAFAGLLVGNRIGVLGLYAADDDRLTAWSALHFLSHDDLAHAASNIQDAALCGLGLLCLRRFRLKEDTFFLIASVLAAWAATMIAFIWILSPSPAGAHGYSVVTHAMLGFMMSAGAASIAMSITAGRSSRAAVAAIMTGFAVLALFIASNPDRSSTAAFNGSIGHLIGLSSGVLGGIAWSVRGWR